MPINRVVLNASPLTCLSKSGLADLLPALFPGYCGLLTFLANSYTLIIEDLLWAGESSMGRKIVEATIEVWTVKGS